MSSSSFPPQKLTKYRVRQLIIKFFEANDPTKLLGLDLNELVKFVEEKGLDALNSILFKEYGTKIDINGGICD